MAFGMPLSAATLRATRYNWSAESCSGEFVSCKRFCTKPLSVSPGRTVTKEPGGANLDKVWENAPPCVAERADAPAGRSDDSDAVGVNGVSASRVMASWATGTEGARTPEIDGYSTVCG